MDIILVYTGFVLAFVGFVCLLKPLRFLRIRRRRRGAAVLGLGVLLTLVGWALPAPLIRRSGLRRIDEFVPEYQFSEFHRVRVHAPPDRVFQAIKSVTPEEIRFFRTLTWIRSPRLPWTRGRESILNAPARRPMLDVALHSGFGLLAEEANCEIVIGTFVCCGQSPGRIATPQEFAAFDRPGYAKAAMNFSLEDDGDGWTRVTTQTRVFATDASARRKFAVYWRVIYPGSAIIRRMWLQAVKRRAEGSGN